MVDDDEGTDLEAVLADIDAVRVPANYTRHGGKRVRDLEIGTLAWFLTLANPPVGPESFRLAVLDEYRRRCGGGLMSPRLRPMAHMLLLRGYDQAKGQLEDEASKHLLSDAKNALLVLLYAGMPPSPSR